MLRFPNAPLMQLQTDVLLVDVDCIGGQPSAALRQCVESYPEVATAHRYFFDDGQLLPGKILAVKPTESRPTLVYLAATRVHPNSPLESATLKSILDQVLDETLKGGHRSIALLPIPEGRGLTAKDIRREILYSFSRSPELDILLPTDSDMNRSGNRVSIFTDGSSERKGGRGGYGVVLRFGDHCRELSQGFQHTNSDRMELMAAVAGLEALTRRCQVRLYSDSRFVVDTINTGLLFRRASKLQLKKLHATDLWKRFLDQYLEHDVELVWVKGHSGIADNDRCDQLASEASNSDSLVVDAGFGSKGNGRVKKKTEPPDDPKITPSVARMDLPASDFRPKQSGDPCRACGHQLEKRIPKNHKRDAKYRFAWYLYCTNCKRFYHVEEAKVYPGDDK